MLNNSESIVLPAGFKPKHAPAFRYWECSIAASRAKAPEERAAIWAHFTEPCPVMTPKVQCGYYRLRRGQKGERRFVPVAIWERGDVPVLKIDGEMKPDPAAFWERNCAWIEPVSYDDYQYAEEHGRWPGDIQETAPRLGHNADDGGEASGAQFRDQLIDLVGKVEAFIAKEVGPAVAERVIADKLANYREMLALAKKSAESALKEEVAQIKLAVEDRKELWRPALSATDGAVERIRTLLTPWMQAQVAQGLDVKIGGQAGRKMSQRPYWSATITDWGKAVRHFEGHPKLRAVVQELADAAARGKEKTPIDGVEFKSEGRAA
jgi:hypothetical protein